MKDDGPIWAPVGAALHKLRMQFCSWPAELRRLQFPNGSGGSAFLTFLAPGAVGRPTYVREDRLVCANDPNFNPSSEAT